MGKESTQVFYKTLSKRIPTKAKGVYYKEIEKTEIDSKGNIKRSIVDKVFSIRYRDHTSTEHLVTIGKYSDGIRVNYCKTKRAEYLAMAKHGELPDFLQRKIKQKITTLNDIAQVYFNDKSDTNKANTLQVGRYDLHIRPVLGDRDIHAITKADVLKLQSSLKSQGKAPKTINGIIQLLSIIYNHSIKEKDLSVINPCTGVKNLKVDDARERYLSLDEVHRLIDEVREDEVLYHFTKLALTTGARLEGVLEIRKKDINLNDNSIQIRDLKSGGSYTGFYDDAYKEELREHIRPLKANDFVVGASSTKTPTRTIQRHLKRILDRLFNQGLDTRDYKNRVVIHTLRHTFASQLAIAGVPILTIQKLMNHADIAQTMRYAKLAPDQGVEAVKGLYQ